MVRVHGQGAGAGVAFGAGFEYGDGDAGAAQFAGEPQAYGSGACDDDLVAHGVFPSSATLVFADRLVDALLRAGADGQQAAWTAWTVTYFVLGLTQEEQTAPEESDERLARAVGPGTYPALQRVLPHLRQDFEKRFTFGLGAILSRIPA
jgi:TetR/AcrR family tetracycline transcriptional repressor